MAYTTMKTWGSEVLTSSDMNTYLRDNIEYLKGISDGLTFSGVHLDRNAATSINDSIATTISFTSEFFDYGGWWSSGSAVTVPASSIPAGFTSIAVMLRGRAKFATNGTGLRRVSLLQNGSVLASPTIGGISSDETEVDTSFFAIAEAGDVFSLQVYQSSGGALDVSGCVMFVVRFLPAA